MIFTTIQKFSPATGETTIPCCRTGAISSSSPTRRTAASTVSAPRWSSKTGEISYGFAKYLRDALPNASFIGFTGTPIEKDDVNTPAVFGDYIDIYDISRAVEDGATVPIYYESRLARIELPEDEKPKIDAEIEELTEDEAATSRSGSSANGRQSRPWSAPKTRLAMVAADLVRHFEDRVAAMDGKAMIVCMSRRICVALYDEIVALRPDWHSDDDEKA